MRSLHLRSSFDRDQPLCRLTLLLREGKLLNLGQLPIKVNPSEFSLVATGITCHGQSSNIGQAA
jgi:hypothetical protein